MLTKKEKADILAKYPVSMSKEQFYKLCHISKRYARILLTDGTVPCRIRRLATHKYVIATEDVIAYLESIPPLKPKTPGGRKWRGHRATLKKAISVVPPELIKKLRPIYIETLGIYPDVLDPAQISVAIGYSEGTIKKWCVKGNIRYFKVNKTYMVPKPWLIDFLLSPSFLNMMVVSQWHRKVVQPVVAAFMKPKNGDDTAYNKSEDKG